MPPKPGESIEQYRAREARVTLRFIVREIDHFIARQHRRWHVSRRWLARVLKRDPLLAIVAVSSLSALFLAVTRPVVPWGIWQ